MAKVIKLKSIRVQDLITIFGALSPQEISKIKPEESVKTISRVQRLYEELEKANEHFVALNEKYLEPQRKIQEKYQEEIRKLRASKDMDEKAREKEIERMVAEANDELSRAMRKAEKELNYAKEGEKEVEVLVNSDERFALLKDVFEKIAAEKFIVKKPICEISEAIDQAREP